MPQKNLECHLAIQFKKHLISKNIISKSFLALPWSKNSYQNGQNPKVLFQKIYHDYRDTHLQTLSESSKLSKIKRCESFLIPLFDIHMKDITPTVISEFVLFSKERDFYKKSGKRNFDKQIKDLISIFNWYIDHVDFLFRNPVRRQHLKLGVIKEISPKERQISEAEFKSFLSHLSPYFRDLALIQFYSAGRIGEIAGIQKKNIDLDKKILIIKEVVVWIKGVPKIKSLPKNGHPRVVAINSTMEEIIRRRLEEDSDSPFLFHRSGEALRYNLINENYNRAWKKAGLSHKFSGTHQIRYAAAQMARRVSGSLDAAKSITGHKSSQMAEKYSHYTDIELNRKTLSDVEKLMTDS